MLNRKEYQFDMSIRIDNPETLRQAAMAHEDADASDTFLKEDGSINIGACLVMLLDPGKLPGCTIHGSGAEEA